MAQWHTSYWYYMDTKDTDDFRSGHQYNIGICMYIYGYICGTLIPILIFRQTSQYIILHTLRLEMVKRQVPGLVFWHQVMLSLFPDTWYRLWCRYIKAFLIYYPGLSTKGTFYHCRIFVVCDYPKVKRWCVQIIVAGCTKLLWPTT